MTPHVFRILDFDLKPAQILENIPSLVLAKSSTSIGQIVYRYWPNCLLVLAKSPNSIGQIVYWYWPNHLPVLTYLTRQCIHINYAYSYCRHSEIIYLYWWNRLRGIGEIVYWYWQNFIPVLGKGQLVSLVYDFINTSKWFRQKRQSCTMVEIALSQLIFIPLWNQLFQLWNPQFFCSNFGKVRKL